MYLDQSRYGHHLERWFARFARSQIMVVFQEEIAADPERQLRAIYRFVGVNDSWLPGGFGERSVRWYGRGIAKAVGRVRVDDLVVRAAIARGDQELGAVQQIVHAAVQDRRVGRAVGAGVDDSGRELVLVPRELARRAIGRALEKEAVETEGEAG
jgi:Sulfotransferase domain